VTRPTALILDYGEVLSHPMRPGGMSLLASQLGVPESEMTQVYWRHRRDYDLGLPAAEYWALVARELGMTLDEGLLASLITVDVDSWTDYRDEMWILAETFRQRGGRLALLSNGVPEIVARIRADRDLTALFDTQVISFEVGLAKPEPEIYRIVLDRIGTAPAATLFVDDRLENIETARELGIQAAHFTGNVHDVRRLVL
jgi:putative hydrolase of the HAD superfamily